MMHCIDCTAPVQYISHAHAGRCKYCHHDHEAGDSIGTYRKRITRWEPYVPFDDEPIVSVSQGYALTHLVDLDHPDNDFRQCRDCRDYILRMPDYQKGLCRFCYLDHIGGYPRHRTRTKLAEFGRVQYPLYGPPTNPQRRVR